jgi:hypothetical protein
MILLWLWGGSLYRLDWEGPVHGGGPGGIPWSHGSDLRGWPASGAPRRPGAPVPDTGVHSSAGQAADEGRPQTLPGGMPAPSRGPCPPRCAALCTRAACPFPRSGEKRIQKAS